RHTISKRDWSSDVCSSDLDLVVQRFFAVLLEPFVYDEMTVIGAVQDEKFQTKTKHVTKLGWKSVYETATESSRTNQKTKVDQVFSNVKIEIGRASCRERV